MAGREFDKLLKEFRFCPVSCHVLFFPLAHSRLQELARGFLKLDFLQEALDPALASW
jgi:hypothetical protein